MGFFADPYSHGYLQCVAVDLGEGRDIAAGPSERGKGKFPKAKAIDMIAERIARMEGFYDPGDTPAKRNNNPGNLRMWGRNPMRGGFAVFPDVEAGWKALRRQVELNIERDLTWYEFFEGKRHVYGGYAPRKDKNKPDVYAAFVAEPFGADINERIQESIHEYSH